MREHCRKWRAFTVAEQFSRTLLLAASCSAKAGDCLPVQVLQRYPQKDHKDVRPRRAVLCNVQQLCRCQLFNSFQPVTGFRLPLLPSASHEEACLSGILVTMCGSFQDKVPKLQRRRRRR